MRISLLFLTLLLAKSSLQAGWSFSAKLTQSGPCSGNATSGITIPPISGLPTKAMCESTRAQILAIRSCVAMYGGCCPSTYLGQCCVFYNCTACSGFDDPTGGAGTAGGDFSSGGAAQGKAFFSKNRNTENLDWERETEARLKVFGNQMNDLMAQMKAPSTGDSKFDSNYQKQMAKSYGGGAYDQDSSVVRIGAGSDGIPRIPRNNYEPPPIGAMGSARFSAAELAGFSAEEFGRYLENLSPEEKMALKAEMEKQLGSFERKSNAYQEKLDQIEGNVSEKGYRDALINTVRNTTLMGAVAGLAFDLYKNNESQLDVSSEAAWSKSLGQLAESIQKRYPGIPAKAANDLAEAALAYKKGDAAKIAESLGKAAVGLADPKLLYEIAKKSDAVKNAIKDELGEGFLSTGLIKAGKAAGAIGVAVDIGEKVIELGYQAGMVRQDNHDIRTSNDQKQELKARLIEEKLYADQQAEKLRKLKSQIGES